jgi:hypothetical protein
MWDKASFRILSFLALAVLLGIVFLVPKIQAANHREAPITALDHKADITDWYAFRSYEPGREDSVTLILDVDPLLEPSNGPNYFPFDPEIKYRLIIDNNRDGVDDIIYEVQFATEIRLPDVFTGFVGDIPGLGIPPITALDGPGSEGFSLRQKYTLTVLNGDGDIIDGPFSTDAGGNPLIAVPSNVGPKTMPNYNALASQGIYTLSNGIRIFAGTVDDPFYIDLGGAFDTLNVPVAVLTDEQDADDSLIVGEARDDVSGFNVNAIAIEVPIVDITTTGTIPPADSPDAVIGTYGATFRPRTKSFNEPGEMATLSTDFVQIQRMGNPLINELIIGTGSKDLFSMSEPEDDEQFAAFFLDPLAATLLNVIFGVNVPPAPRLDLLPLVLYIAPICPGCSPDGEGPIADLLRLNVGIPPTPVQDASRLGALVGDFGGHPNGRRVFDDVVDIFLRVGAGVLAGPPFDGFPNNRLGDGVNRNDMPYQNEFPYLAFAQNGRDSRHVDRFEPLTLGGDDNGDNGGGCAIANAGTVNIGNLASAFGVFLIPVLYVFVRRFVSNNRKS